MPAYISREEAVRLARAAEPHLKISDTHIFHGDIFEKHLYFYEPRPGGTSNTVLAEAAIIVSHACEYTKAEARGIASDYPLLVAPLRRLDAFPDTQHQQFRDGKIVAAPYLPMEAPIDDEYIVDLKLTQPFAAADLMEAPLVCCMHPDQRRLFQNRVSLFLFRDRILDS